MKQNGFSLLEVLIVIAIAGIAAGLGVASLQGMVRKHNVDNQIRRLYSDLMDVRLMAMNKNRTHFVALSTGGYTAYDDTSPAPNGDDTLSVGSDAVAMTSQSLNLSTVKPADFLPIVWSAGSQINFNARGLSTTSNTICIYSELNPVYDCLKISATRVLLGKLSTQGTCSDATCDAK
jgi:prepilin-type N-terminal cleavage/methylation domain-containing protein